MVAIVCLWVVGQMLFLSSFSEERAQELLYSRLRTDVASAVAPIGPVTPVGDPVALLTIRQRPTGNALVLAGVAVAAAGSGLAGLGVAETAAFVALAALLLYAGFTHSPRRTSG